MTTLATFVAGTALFAGRVDHPGPQERSFALLFEGPGAVLNLTTIDPDTGAVSEQPLSIPSRGRALSPQLEKDGEGKAWLLWEDWDRGESAVGLGALSESGSVHVVDLVMPAGSNAAPDLAFDSLNRPWLVWVNSLLDEQTLLVRDVRDGLTWALAAGASIACPQLLIDRQDRVWVFWAETRDRQSRIMFRRLDSRTWSPASGVSDARPYPATAPAVAEHADGTVWAFWSQFDGRDYEIAAATWDGARFAAAGPLSDNELVNDTAPMAASADGRLLVLAWVRYTGREPGLVLRSFRDGWSGEEQILQFRAQDALPSLSVEPGHIALSWTEGGRPQWRLLSVAEIEGLFAPHAPAGQLFLQPERIFPRPLPHFIYNPSLDENEYIGFGDSITYGTLDYEFHPELGYVPRLQALLSQSFGPTTVINEGVPSEITANGLARLAEVESGNGSRYILILEGTNDTVTKIFSVEASAFNLMEMGLRSMAFGVFPCLSTLTPRFDNNAKPAYIRSLNERIRQVAAELAVPLVDFYDLFMDYPLDEGGVMSLISSDLLHPSEKGYQFMAQKWHEAIRNYPFAPVNLQVRRDYDRILFFEKAGNMVTWETNPKILEPGLIQGYRVYRKESASPDSGLRLLQFVQGKTKYFDTEITPGTEYTYVVATVLTDGTEGPGSLPVKY